MSYNNRLIIPLTILTTGTVAVAYYLLYDKESKHINQWKSVFRHLLYSPELARRYELLDRIQQAEKIFNQQLVRSEQSILFAKANKSHVDAATKKCVLELNVDLDYIFSTLDGVTGEPTNSSVKAERKRLVDTFKAYAARVDALLAELES